MLILQKIYEDPRFKSLMDIDDIDSEILQRDYMGITDIDGLRTILQQKMHDLKDILFAEFLTQHSANAEDIRLILSTRGLQATFEIYDNLADTSVNVRLREALEKILTTSSDSSAQPG